MRTRTINIPGRGKTETILWAGGAFNGRRFQVRSYKLLFGSAVILTSGRYIKELVDPYEKEIATKYVNIKYAPIEQKQKRIDNFNALLEAFFKEVDNG